ncbi:MAG: restriction endonuclease subunit S [Parvibaculum sp.]
MASKTHLPRFSRRGLLLALYGQGKTRGQVGLLAIDAATNQACAAIRAKPEVDAGYLYEFLKGSYLTIRGLSNSGGQENLSATIVSEIQVPLPPLPEQRKIAEILRTWDEAIEKLEALRAAKERRLHSLREKLTYVDAEGERTHRQHPDQTQRYRRLGPVDK